MSYTTIFLEKDDLQTLPGAKLVRVFYADPIESSRAPTPAFVMRVSNEPCDQHKKPLFAKPVPMH